MFSHVIKNILMRLSGLIIITSIIYILSACKEQVNSNTKMSTLLHNVFLENEVPSNVFSTSAKIAYFDSLGKMPGKMDHPAMQYYRGRALLEAGREEEAIPDLLQLLNRIPASETATIIQVKKDIALSWMRLGERTNCINNHSTESCIFPVSGKGIHTDKTGSENAIAIYEELLNANPDDLGSRWLMNIAYMTTDGYPDKVPAKYLIPVTAKTSVEIKPFQDAAIKTGLNTLNIAGGSIVEDFNNDGYLDVITSSMDLKQEMRYCINNGDGTFSDLTTASGLNQFGGGLHIMQTDYNNDGLKDVFVVRGAWKRNHGKEPNSLLRNNGDGTFTDVTEECGLLSFYPTQAATWADFNNDGWLDVFIGNEPCVTEFDSPTELYINNKGVFKLVTKESGTQFADFVKGVTSGDYNNDGWPDIFCSSLSGKKTLLKNIGPDKNGIPQFKDVTIEAGITSKAATFSTWFWDFDNDGWLDILACGYKLNESLAGSVAASYLGLVPPTYGGVVLMKNNGDGTFTDISLTSGMSTSIFAMGSNFADIDNDGFLDCYFGTGNPDYTSLIPNKLFRNVNGKYFEDITTPARVGNLQKGHGISMADMDNDGDLDIHIDMGGAYKGDGYQNSLYINPGQNDNNWINLSLKGVKANAAAIGAKIKISFTENNQQRYVYREVNSGSSFGANPLLQHIGIGKANKIDKIEIIWPIEGSVQEFTNLAVNKTFIITEGSNNAPVQELKTLNFLDPNRKEIGCAPVKEEKHHQ